MRTEGGRQGGRGHCGEDRIEAGVRYMETKCILAITITHVDGDMRREGGR